jgi:putative Mg2+ transporter-C (MgtC) family protein
VRVDPCRAAYEPSERKPRDELELRYPSRVDGVTVGVQLSIVERIALAALFGFLVGLERESRGKQAGERTFALVALGASAFTALGVELFPESAEKVMAGVATGIGFLGVGIIWREEGGQSRGLTTAAATWAVAAVGVLAGAGLQLSAALATVLVLAILEFEYLPFTGSWVHRMPEDDRDPGDPQARPPSPTSLP